MKKFSTAIFAIITVAIVVSAPFLLKNTEHKSMDNSLVLTVWHVDAFEGGKGSRCTFLRNVATSYTKENQGVYLLVQNFSIEGFKDALKAGKHPDIVSFGGCDLGVENFAREIKFDGQDGGVVGKKRYAIAYLKGGYFKLTKGNGKSETILSSSEYSAPMVACLFSDVASKNYVKLSSNDAINRFIVKADATLIGTQRDVIRLINNNQDFSITPISTYNDLYQYLSLTTSDEEKISYCEDFIAYVLSSKIQAKISSLGMFSASGSVLYSGDEYFSSYEKAKNEYTYLTFGTKESYDLLKNTVFNELEKGTSYDIIVNSCKNLINVVK